jgi:hypothetical protein
MSTTQVIFKKGKLIPKIPLRGIKENAELLIEIKEDKDVRKTKFFRFVEEHSFSLPDDYKFDRELAHER